MDMKNCQKKEDKKLNYVIIDIIDMLEKRGTVSRFTLTRAQSRKRARRAADLAAKQPCHEVHVTTWLG